MSYRPITDVWILGRPKVKYHGAYPSGFLERARPLLGCTDDQQDRNAWPAVMHVCGGIAHKYNGVHGGIMLAGYGDNDFRVDVSTAVDPDVLFDVRNLHTVKVIGGKMRFPCGKRRPRPRAAIIDRPYTLEDADNYQCGREAMPKLNKLLADTLRLVVPGGIVGVLDYKWPRCNHAKNLALISVNCGFDNNTRIFTTWRLK